MKYKVGDRVRIKSLDWYNKNKDEDGNIRYKRGTAYPIFFTKYMSRFCGETVTIKCVHKESYYMNETGSCEFWTDEMIEGLVEEEIKPKFKVGDKIKLKSTLLNDIFGVIGYESEGYRITNISNGLTYFMSYSIEHYYELVEEESKNTDDINRESKITYTVQHCSDLIPYDSPNYLDELRATAESYVKAEDDKYFQEYMNSLCKEHDEMIEECMKDGTIVDYVKESNDKYRIVIDPRFDIEVDEGEYYAVRRKKEYPKTYEECYCVLLERASVRNMFGYKADLMVALQKLLVCRDAYWKIAGEEMGLGKPWEPDYTNTGEKKFSIWVDFGEIKLGGPFTTTQMVLSFPTEEMRDMFYENFRVEIENCKELL